MVKRADAPPAGWYPDPEGGARLRWWDGTDWSDRFRAPPSPAELHRQAMSEPRPAAGRAPTVQAAAEQIAARHRRDADEIVSQVRQVARDEIERAADLFSARARAATRDIQPLVSEYTNRILRFLRIALVLAVILVAAWFVFQAVAQVSFFEWLGDRIDNLSNDE